MTEGHGVITNDLHVTLLSNCELRSNNLNLFKGVTADKSVVKSDCGSV